MQRNIYLKMIPIAQAVETIRSHLDRNALVQSATVQTAQAAGMVTAAPVFAALSSPVGHCAAMDGIAVRAQATFAAREGEPLTLKLGQDFGWVNTGHPLPVPPNGPEGADAVLMIEHVTKLDEQTVTIEAPAFPFQHVRKLGEDIVATELVVPRHHRLSPYDLGALLTAGVFELDVFEPIRMVIIPTGDEILDYTQKPTPGPGQVVESNSVMLAALAESWGVRATRVPPVADDADALETAVRQALAGGEEPGAHIVVLCAGSSAGSKDFTRTVMERLGQVVVHGLSAMPGKPSLFGVADQNGGGGQLLVGAPGYPVSAVVCFEQVLAPILAWLGRRPLAPKPTRTMRLTRAVPSKPGLTEFVRLAAGTVGGEVLATPLGRGAGLISTLSKAQAMARVPELSEGLEAGTEVEAELLVAAEDLDRTLVVVGSHDNTLDLLADLLMALDGDPVLGGPYRLAAPHVGSLGGIAALAQGRALAAGAHLFHPETGDFNFPFLAKHAQALDVTVVNLAIRHQGLIVAPGNPKSIQGVNDLARPDVSFVNRQRGAGTRILTDYRLAKAGIDPKDVNGYAAEEFTHMAVAAAVATGGADCGTGIFAAAKALGLGFAPLAHERYDLCIPTAHLDDPRIAALLAVVRSDGFSQAVQGLGGYETTLTGQVMRPGQGLEE